MDIIRKLQPFDVAKCMRIWYDGNLTAHDFIPKDYWDRNFNYIKRTLPDGEVYVYEINGEVVGFIGVDEGYVEGLYVQSDYQTMGVGTKLIDYIKDRYALFTLHVFEKNQGAVTFYEHRGMKMRSQGVHEDLGEVEYYMYYRRKEEKKEDEEAAPVRMMYTPK